MKLSELLKEVAPLSRDQHGLLRDAGFERDEVCSMNHYAYQQIRGQAEYESSKGPGKPTQFEHLKRRGVQNDTPDASYEALRAVIRHFAQIDADDELYLQYIAKAERESQQRAERRKRAKAQKENADEHMPIPAHSEGTLEAQNSEPPTVQPEQARRAPMEEGTTLGSGAEKITLSVSRAARGSTDERLRIVAASYPELKPILDGFKALDVSLDYIMDDAAVAVLLGDDPEPEAVILAIKCLALALDFERKNSGTTV
jgi:hypothetical protein